MNNSIGLKALPESWIGQGKSKGTITTTVASGDVKVERSQDSLVLDAVNPVYPDLEVHDRGNGKVEMVVDMPWPVKDITLKGQMVGSSGKDYTVTIQDEKSGARCQLSQPEAGQVRGIISGASQEDVWFVYQAEPKK